MRDSRGFTPLVVIIILTALIGIGAVTFVIVKKQEVTPDKNLESTTEKDITQEDTQKLVTPSQLLGLWREEKRLGYDTDTNTWKEMRPRIPGTPLHYDFKENGTTCSVYSIDNKYECFKGDPYTVDADIVRIERPGLTITVGGTRVPSTETYRWEIVDGKLELTTQGPFRIKHIAERIPYPPPKSKAIPPLTPPSGFGRPPEELSPPTQQPPQEAPPGTLQEPTVIQPPPAQTVNEIQGYAKRDYDNAPVAAQIQYCVSAVQDFPQPRLRPGDEPPFCKTNYAADSGNDGKWAWKNPAPNFYYRVWAVIKLIGASNPTTFFYTGGRKNLGDLVILYPDSVIAPSFGDCLLSNQPYVIHWISKIQSVDHFTIRYYFPPANHPNYLIAQVPGNVRSYSWLPGFNASSVQIDVMANGPDNQYLGGMISDEFKTASTCQ